VPAGAARMKRKLLLVFALGLGCQSLEPLGGGAIRVADGSWTAEGWFALSDGEELIPARDADGTLHLLGLEGGPRCELGTGQVRAVVGRDDGESAPTLRIVLTTPAQLEVRNLQCELVGSPLPMVRQTTTAFEYDGSFALVALDHEDVLWSVDLMDGSRVPIGGSTGRFGVRDQSAGQITYGVQWTDGGEVSRPRLWTVDGGEVVVTRLGGSEIGRAGSGVLGVRSFDPMWLWDADGLKRWYVGEAPPELLVPQGCDPQGTHPLYVRAPCARGDLLALDETDDEVSVVASDVTHHQHFAAGNWLTYVQEVNGQARQTLVSADDEAREVPLDARPLGAHGQGWFLRDGASIVRLGPDGGAPEELLSHLHAHPTVLSDGRFLVVYGESSDPPALAAFDPTHLGFDVLAEGVPVGDVRLAVASLTGRSVLFFRSGVTDGLGRLEAILWPEGPRVEVADGVTSFRPILNARPPALLYATGGADPALWLVPI
jgi:hypothetical protein